MKIKAFIEREKRTVETSINNPTIKSLLEELKINPVTVIVTINGEVCTEEEKICSKDKVNILSVVSGG
ncbi:MAG: MoaD/ThiS family protein [Nanoarchaeota archaeon]|nr:MoaD/ThiS family protein [Nanoarchaeota archaeon]